MSPKRTYSSALRSKNRIRSAFLELLHEKNFEKITVTDIVTRANINRSTFYAHYPDMIGLLDEIQEEIIARTQQIFEEADYSVLKTGSFSHWWYQRQPPAMPGEKK